MAALLSYGVNADTHVALFAIAADDGAARYVWPSLTTPGFGDDRIQQLALDLGTPEDAAGWLSLAATNVGQFIKVTAPHEVESLADGVAEARQVLNQSAAGRGDTPAQHDPEALQRIQQSFDQISQDYPGFGEGGDDDPQAMTNFVLHMLGGVDPGDPNAWILEAAENPNDNPDIPAPDFVRMPGVDYDRAYPPVPDDEDGEE